MESNINPKLAEYLGSNPLLYVTRDKERGMGLGSEPTGFKIISGDMSTLSLLASGDVKRAVEDTGSSIVVFKNTIPIENLCQAKGWKLLNPSAALAETVEGKISQIDWLGKLSALMPTYQIAPIREIHWKGEPFVLQYNRTHSGEGTFLISGGDQLTALADIFPDRPVRTTKLIEGPVFTNNNVVTKNSTLVSNISYQITGDNSLTDNQFATVGNDWGLASEMLNDNERKTYTDIAEHIGETLRAAGWRGMFGIDVVRDAGSGKMYLLEINARQPASSVYESQLQKDANPEGLSVFEAHLMSIVGLTIEGELTKITKGRRTVNRKES